MKKHKRRVDHAAYQSSLVVEIPRQLKGGFKMTSRVFIEGDVRANTPNAVVRAACQLSLTRTLGGKQNQVRYGERFGALVDAVKVGSCVKHERKPQFAHMRALKVLANGQRVMHDWLSGTFLLPHCASGECDKGGE